MKNNNIVVRILMVIGFFVVASIALRLLGVVLSIGFSLFFKLVIPLAIAYFLVNWLTNRRRSNYR